MGIQTGVKSRNLVTENADFEHHYLAAYRSRMSAQAACSESFGRCLRFPFVPKADIHGPIRSHLDTRNGNQRSISPNTMSREPSIAGTSASMCPRVKKSIAAKCGNDGARILHLYGWLVPSETR